MKRWVLILLFILYGCDSVLESDNKMILEYFQTQEPLITDHSVYGMEMFEGWEKLDRKYYDRIVSADLSNIHIEASPAICKFRDKYFGQAIIIRNSSSKYISIPSIDDRIRIVQEAKDAQGNWRQIEWMGYVACGNSYVSQVLNPNTGALFVVPVYRGEFDTVLRCRLMLHNEQYIYTKEYKGSIYFSQFMD